MAESRYPIGPIDLSGISTYPLSERRSKVSVEQFGKPLAGDENVLGFIAKLPRILAGESLRSLIRAILFARVSGKPVVWGIGGHVIKCGLGPVLIDLMRHGFATAIAMNGSAAIHDFETGLVGSTSEEVESEIGSGRFGMARETGELFNAAVSASARDGIGLGEGLGRLAANDSAFIHRSFSVLAAAHQLTIPVTVHVAIGTDIVHTHPAMNAEATGQTTHYDFRLLCSLVAGLHSGGVYLNVGSAVVLPEVFLKAVSVVRNLGTPLEEFTTANLDFIQHYRPTQNVLKRPTQGSGQAIAVTGHHEILIPLLAAALKASAAQPNV